MSKTRHCSHNKQAPAAKFNQRIAEESQLLAEERWIIEALKKIKAQRNGLQIERLHLESMRSKLLEALNPELTKETSVPASSTTNADEEMPEAAASIPNVPEISTCFIDNEQLSQHKIVHEELCNMEELNLSVTNSVYHNKPYAAQCDEEEDEEDMDNCLLDINMFMNAE